MAGWFVLSTSKNGQFYFVLKAANGETILVSETYTRREAVANGMASVRKHCQDDANYERKQAGPGKFYFNLRSANYQVIGASEMYNSAAARDAGIEAVKVNGIATTVKVEE